MTKSIPLNLLILVFLIGCGDSGPQVVPVHGRVTMDGEELANVSIIFTPIDGTEGHGAAGSTDNQGIYSLRAVVPGALRDYEGAVPGKYRVTLSESMFPASAFEPKDDENQPQAAAAPDSTMRDRLIPEVYCTENSPLVVEIPSSDGVVDIKLLSVQE